MLLRNPRSPIYISQIRFFWSKKNPEVEKDDHCKELEDPSLQEDISEDKVPETWTQPKVVIVGAGIAGLSAAHRLVKSGLCDVTILEATDRPGGRIQSCWFTNRVAELGASVIQGANVANSVYNLAVVEHLTQEPLVHFPASSGLFYTSRGKPIDIALVHKAYAAFNHIERAALSLYGQEVCDEDAYMDSFMTYRIEKEIMNFPESERPGALMVLNHLLNSLREKVGTHLECIHTQFYGSLPSSPAGNVTIPVGFIGTLAPLIREIPDCSIKYCKPVKSIDWNVCEADRPRASVKCVGEDSYPADYVLVTSSLGFLKDNAHTFFSPALPERKQNAIEHLGFGHLNKLYLQFSEPMWSKDEGTIMFAWHPDDYAKTDSWIKGLNSLTIEDAGGCVLSAVLSGQDAVTLETLDAEQIKNDVQRQLQCFLGNLSLPRPTSILRSKWTSNAYTRGAFTYIGNECGMEHIKALAEPTPEPCEVDIPVLLFAGEHTSTTGYSTVHGARDSGIREADRIIKFTKTLKGAPSVKPPKES